MRKLKYSNKINQETALLSEMINNYVKKMNKEYVCNMNKLIELIARGENLDVNRLKTKYLGYFKSTSDGKTDEIEQDEQAQVKLDQGELAQGELAQDELAQDSVSSVNDEIYLDKILIDHLEYWYEKKNKGNIYYNNNLVGNYNNNIFEINGKKYNNKLQLLD